MLLRKIYYTAKPLIPRGVQLGLRRARIRMLRDEYRQTWPIYKPAAKGIASGTQWPDRKRFALVLTHDVEGPTGRDRCRQLVQIERELGFRSAFYFVPERYATSDQLRNYMTEQGFEVGVHGLNHDGKLYNNASLFGQRVSAINDYLDQWNVSGFSSPCAHHNLEWTPELNIRYAVTTYDTDPFEPQGGGIGTVFPFRVHNCQTGREYIEIPYTLPQDFALYVLMREKSFALWKEKLDWIAQNGGMAHLKTHPDYMSFDAGDLGAEEYPISYYADFLRYVKETYADQYWHVCPSEMADYYFDHADEKPWRQAYGETLCQACRSSLENNRVLVFGASHNGN
ncbi:MAG: polysaccharide deacetylase family protein [Planctomycetota bacterium]